MEEKMANRKIPEPITKKGRQAFFKLEVINKQMEDLRKKLIQIEGFLVDHLKASLIEPRRQRIFNSSVLKQMVFMYNGLRFYIEFTVVASETDQNGLEGRIVYGTSKTVCFVECPEETRLCCERVPRCDCLEDKPLIQFSVDQHGMIQSSGKLQDEWWVWDKDEAPADEKNSEKEDRKALLDLHYRALEAIWKEALDWVNEDILP